MSWKTPKQGSFAVLRVLSLGCCTYSPSMAVQPVSPQGQVIEVKTSSKGIESKPVVRLEFASSEDKRNSSKSAISEGSVKFAEEVRSPSELSKRTPARPEMRKGKSKKSMMLRGNRHKSIFGNDMNEFELTLWLPQTRDNFIAFIKKEHSEENVYFYETVVRLKDSKDFRKDLDMIMHTYIQEGSEMEINIPAHMRSKIVDAYRKNIHEDDMYALIVSAKEEIFTILLGSFERYKKSEIQKSLS